MTSSNTFNTVSYNKFAVFIKRASCNVTQDYIRHVFYRNAIGVVDNVEFIERKNDLGQAYYNAIVTFSKIFSGSSAFKKIICDINKSSDGTVRFYYNDRGYWHIKRHLNESTEINLDGTSEDLITKVVGHLHTELKFSDDKCRKLESRIEKYEKKMTQEKMRIVNLELQIDDIKREKDDYIDIANNLRKEVDMLTLDNEIGQQDKEKATNLVEELKTEARDFENILSMISKEICGIRRLINDDVDIVLKNKILILHGMINGIYK